MGIAIFLAVAAGLAVVVGLSSSSRDGPGHLDARTSNEMKALGIALQCYQRDFGVPPCDSHTLGAWDMSGEAFRTRRFVRAGLAGPGVYYFPEAVDPNAPDDWIVAYEAWVDADQKSLGILYASGVVRRPSMPEFRREIERFCRAYAAARGVPPRVVEAHAAADSVSSP